MEFQQILTGGGEKLIESVYRDAHSGIPLGPFSLKGVEEFAEEYRWSGKKIVDAADQLIRDQKKICAFSNGFTLIPYVGGPANVYATLVIQMRMILGIAYLGGHDTSHPHIKNYAISILFGIRIARKGVVLTAKGGKKISQKVSKPLSNSLGSQKGAVLLSKMIPFLGVGLGAGLDWFLTEELGQRAKKRFVTYRV